MEKIKEYSWIILAVCLITVLMTGGGGPAGKRRGEWTCRRRYGNFENLGKCSGGRRSQSGD